MSSRSWVRWFVSTTFLCTTNEYQGIQGKCGVLSLGGNTYNISSLICTSGSRFGTVDPWGWSYSFNPCVSFKMGSSGNCTSDVAICRWVKKPAEYIKIGSQSSEELGYYKKTKKPKLQYSSGLWKAAVLLRCDPKEKKGTFIAREYKKQDDFLFILTHQCACPNSCLFSPSTHTTKDPTATTDPITLRGDPTDNIVIYVVPSVAGGVVLFLFLLVIWWQLRIRCRNNDYPPLINHNDGGEVNQIVNEYPDTSEGSELTSGRNSASITKLPSSGSSCSDITEPKKDRSFNSKVKIKRYTEGIC